ncbi:MAG: hypothetical protein ACO1SV_20250 [Fimbriimonas sp.]
MRLPTLFAVFTLVASAVACLNDRDTLARQAERMPDLVRTATGRFERNPALYYQSRIKRVEGEIGANPGRLDLYDDVAVAYDRLGDSDTALKWMVRKRAQLDAKGGKIVPKKGKTPLDPLSDAWYRYYANIGTFRMHRWLGEGGKEARLKEATQARAEIDKALWINKDAHFGREKVQLATMDWIIATTKGENVQALGPWLLEHPRLKDHRAPKIAEGLSGLVVMGNAWESPDAFGALAYLAQDNPRLVEFGALIDERREELVRDGKRMRIPSRLETMPVTNVHDATRREFQRLRTEADAWHGAREAFMLARLKAGKHPDVDADFWQGYEDTPPPKLDASIRPPTTSGAITQTLVLVGALFLIGLAILVYAVVNLRRRFKLRAAHMGRPRVP